MFSASTAFTWHDRHTIEVAAHTYPSAGLYRAEMSWGEARAAATVGAGIGEPTGSAALPEVILFQAAPLADRPLEVKVRLEVARWPADAELRVDGGAGQVQRWSRPAAEAATAEWTLAYPKPGAYTVAVDLVDGEGHIVDNSGFVVLFNPSQESRKVLLPLDEPGLGLSGELRLSDWSELESGVDMGVAKPGDLVEVTLPPVSAKIIGINIVP